MASRNMTALILQMIKRTCRNNNMSPKRLCRNLTPCCVKERYYDTPKYVAHVLGRVISKKYRYLPKKEITDRGDDNIPSRMGSFRENRAVMMNG